MLVLSRKKNECIVIGDNIKIVIVESRGDKVRLGIDAPCDVSVHRQEVYDAIAGTPAKQQDAGDCPRSEGSNHRCDPLPEPMPVIVPVIVTQEA